MGENGFADINMFASHIEMLGLTLFAADYEIRYSASLPPHLSVQIIRLKVHTVLAKSQPQSVMIKLL